jgi:hypothetical protein
MTDIVWEDPVPPRRGRPPAKDWRPFVSELRKHPGKWAVVVEKAKYGSSANQAKKHLRALDCEVTGRTQPDGTWTFYARWPEDAS